MRAAEIASKMDARQHGKSMRWRSTARYAMCCSCMLLCSIQECGLKSESGANRSVEINRGFLWCKSARIEVYCCLFYSSRERKSIMYSESVSGWLTGTCGALACAQSVAICDQERAKQKRCVP